MKVFQPSLDHYLDVPSPKLLINPLIDVPERLLEDNPMTEFYKLGNQFYSPEFGVRYIMGCNLYPFQMSMLRAVMNHKFPMLLLTRGGGKTFKLAIIAVYHAIMHPNCRIVLISGTFRQAKLIFQEIERIYNNAPLLRLISQKPPTTQSDRCIFSVHGSTVVGLPLGEGDKIRGERGHVILVDEFDSIKKEVFDVVIRGFGATQSDPWEKTRDILLALKKKKSAGLSAQEQASSMAAVMDSVAAGNKIVISGTAGHNTGPFYKLFSQYLKIIQHKIQGSLKDHSHVLGGEDVDEDVEVDYKQYCIIRYKYTDLPVGMMDVKMIHNARATMSKMYFLMEYMCKFADDSLGFFKWKDIQNATESPPGPHAICKGRRGAQYVMGIDPARTRDRFAVTIIELGKPLRVVYCWTAQNLHYHKSFRKVRELIRLFNIVGIALDTNGNGLTIKDMFEQKEYMEVGDFPIVPYDADPAKMEIPEGAKKILYPFSFAPTWIEEANVLMQKNIEEKTLMFPIENVMGIKGAEFEGIDQATHEIREQKKELVAIEVTYSKSGAKQFNLKPPEIKSEPGETILHKDRYSSLLLANYVASKLQKLEIFDPNAAAAGAYRGHEKIGGWLEEFES